MSKLKEGHRRSPRISALDACKTQQPRRVAVSTSGGTSTSTRQEMEVHQSHSQPKGPASRTRTRKRRKLRPLEDVAANSIAKPHQGGHNEESYEDHPTNSDQPLEHDDDSPKHEDQANYPGQSSSVPSTTWMPEKRILELILDILQRRDTYEIFAEPVDPEEVEDYYEIIKEPMDFGTMRAKLHEGMYSSLEQFEHDVFLISRNAMHFNSSATIYFRQARAIYELAKKVFHALKTDQENFESDFSETRRRTGRRPHSEARGLLNSSSSKPAANMRSSSMTIDESSKKIPYSFSGSSNLRRGIKGNPGCFSSATHFNTRYHVVLSGARDGRRTGSFEVDRRSAYRPWTSFLSENDSIVSTIYNDSKSLMHVNWEVIGYKESLMLFVKDLGPTAQMIAKQKLFGWPASASHSLTPVSNYWFHPQKCQNPTTSTSVQLRPTTPDTVTITQTSQNVLGRLHGHHSILGSASGEMGHYNADRGEKADTGDSICGSSAEVALSNDGKKIHPTDVMNVVTNKIHQNGSIGIQLGSFSSISGIRDLNFSDGGFKNAGNKSTGMILDKHKYDNEPQPSESALKQPQAEILDFTSENNSSSLGSLQTTAMPTFSQTKDSTHNLSSWCPRANDGPIAAQGRSHEDSGSSEAVQASMSSQSLPTASKFIFDLPYLKTRLDQINSSGQDGILWHGSDTENPFSEKMSYQRNLTCNHQRELSIQPYNDKYQQFSLDTQHSDLALQQ